MGWDLEPLNPLMTSLSFAYMGDIPKIIISRKFLNFPLICELITFSFVTIINKIYCIGFVTITCEIYFLKSKAKVNVVQFQKH